MNIDTLLPKLVHRDFMKPIMHDGTTLDRHDIFKILNDNIEYKYDYFSFIGDFEIILEENASKYCKVKHAASENIYLRVKTLLDMNKMYGWKTEELYTVSGEFHPIYLKLLNCLTENEKVPLELVNEFFELRFTEPDWDMIHYIRQLTYNGMKFTYSEFPQFKDFVSYYHPILTIVLAYL